jgi:hypothetical protein
MDDARVSTQEAAVFHWMRTLLNRLVIDDVPPEMDMCLDCPMLECSEEKFQTCATRKQRALELTGGRRCASGMSTRRCPPTA